MTRPPLSSDDQALLELLWSRKPSELVPVMLELARRRSSAKRPADLVAQLDRDAFLLPSKVDLRTSLAFDLAAMTAASEFEGILLSPLAPVGTCSAISPTTQDRSIVTTRNNEVVSDPTNALALICAQRLKKSRGGIRLATIHQVLRPQRFPAQYGWSQHFRLFALAEAGYAQGEHEFEIAAMIRHAKVYLDLFDLAQKDLGATISGRSLVLHVSDRQTALGDRLERRIRTELPGLPLICNPQFESNYYDGARLLVQAAGAKSKDPIPLGDIGLFDWMHKLTSNKRTRFIASGLGIQTLALMFR